MVFEGFSEAQSVFLWSTFAVAAILGAVVNKTNFCTMGAVSDLVNMGDTGRIRAWLFAIAVAILGVIFLEANGFLNASHTFPPYRSSQLIWAENLLGGLIFGIGMTLGSGCANKTMVRLGAGNLKSLVVLLMIAVVAYFMINPFPGTDKTLFSELFYPWIRPLALQLSTDQDLGALVSADNPATARMWIGGILGLLLIGFAFKSSDFRGRFDNVLGGLVVGLVVLAAWYITGSMRIVADGDTYTMMQFVENWDMVSETDAGKPALVGPLNAQSFTFINPSGQTLGYVSSGFDSALVTFGVMALAGVIFGSFMWALFSKGFRIEWFGSLKDFGMHILGGILMGFGGVLALGCTIGQGVTGVSTLALGSFIALGGIVFGSALTMKVQYYKMVYEDEASFLGALLSSLVDMRLLPRGMRKLDAV